MKRNADLVFAAATRPPRSSSSGAHVSDAKQRERWEMLYEAFASETRKESFVDVVDSEVTVQRSHRKKEEIKEGAAVETAVEAAVETKELLKTGIDVEIENMLAAAAADVSSLPTHVTTSSSYTLFIDRAESEVPPLPSRVTEDEWLSFHRSCSSRRSETSSPRTSPTSSPSLHGVSGGGTRSRSNSHARSRSRTAGVIEPGGAITFASLDLNKHDTKLMTTPTKRGNLNRDAPSFSPPLKKVNSLLGLSATSSEKSLLPHTRLDLSQLGGGIRGRECTSQALPDNIAPPQFTTKLLRSAAAATTIIKKKKKKKKKKGKTVVMLSSMQKKKKPTASSAAAWGADVRVAAQSNNIERQLLSPSHPQVSLFFIL